MKIKEQLKKFRLMDEKALVAELKNLKKELTLDSLKVKAGKLDNISLIEKTKRDIARINSVLSEKIDGAQNE